MEQKVKKRILFFVFIILLLPFVQQCLPFITSGPLFGDYSNAPDIEFSWDKWFDGTYQKGKTDFCNDHVGLRPDLLRLNDQVDFSLFDKCHAAWTILGRDHFLFQYPYINAYYGTDFVGYQTILDKSVKLKAIQDTLSRMGKSLILVYAGNKATFYPEYFPSNKMQEHRGPTNFQAYRHIADSLGINQVDMDTWFVSMKNKSKEPLFSKQGIHWTNYGAILAGDSLVRYMERLTKIHVNHPVWSQMERTDKLRDGDDDVAVGLNLIFPVARETLSYPVVQDVPDSGGRKINAIYIGDSYGFKMVEFGIVYKMNAQCEYWSYFDEVHDINNKKFTHIKDYDWKGAISKSDCVVLVYTAFNLSQLGNGFIEQAYDYYYPAKK